MKGKISRRDFIKLSGVGAAAAAALTGCGPASRYVVRQPYGEMPEYNHTGFSTYFATTCRECPAGCGIVVRTQEGRAIKIEGNPNHPVNRGKICSKGLTAVQGLYNPDRIQEPRQYKPRGDKKFKAVEWDAAIAVVQEALQNAAGVAFLVGLFPDHVYDFTRELSSALKAPEPVRYSAYSMFDGAQALAEAAGVVYGKQQVPYFDIGNAEVVFSFGADFLTSWLSPVTYSRAFGRLRRGEYGQRGYLVSFEARQSSTSAKADLWVPVKPGAEGLVAAALGALVAELRGQPVPPIFAGADLATAIAATGISAEQFRELAARFAQSSRPVALAGGGALTRSDGAAIAQAVLALNVLVENGGKTGGVFLSTTPVEDLGSLGAVQALIERMNNGEVQTLFIHGCNPLFELPATLGFAQALANVPQVISFASFPDETALSSDYILPDHTALEAWGYQRNLAGADRVALSGSQPVVVPLYDTRSTIDVLITAAQGAGGDLAAAMIYNDEVDYIQQKLIPILSQNDAQGLFTAPEIQTFWTLWLQNGGWWRQNPGLEAGSPQDGLESALALPAPPEEDGQLSLVTFETLFGDGQGAN
ncbi:MAG: molybdopterin-dependent oxidoreductase, partial [Anaerolineaceae bacterium]|nr:molybdopterin-dependent oxidoreductase [Anaerolineaceae bacterium]